jgi:hypothetical protein
MALPPLNEHSPTYDVYGVNVSNAVSYGIGQVSINDAITSVKWNELITQVNAERVRRSYASTGLVLSNPISASQYETLRTGISVAGPASSQAYNTSGTINITTYPQAPAQATAPARVSGDAISASTINALINDINNSGAACTCNCNYCTCNCNYCTCNCNYACTCNCNYSDRRLKRNIKFLQNEHGLNIYSFNYIWNNTKSYVGIMAQELLNTKFESALSKDKNGFYMVDYSKLPVEMEAC